MDQGFWGRGNQGFPRYAPFLSCRGPAPRYGGPPRCVLAPIPDPAVDAYIAAAPPPVAARLAALRACIGAAAPASTERMGYGIPTWRQGENLVHIGAFQRHIGLFPGPAAVAAFAEAFAGFAVSKGAIQLPHDAPLPLDAVASLVAWRVERATAAVAAKAAAKAAARAGRGRGSGGGRAG